MASKSLGFLPFFPPAGLGLAVGLAVVLWLLAACAPTLPAPLTPVVVQLSFTHQAEFAGLYAADQQGYFAAQGLQVTFIEGGAEVDFIAPVASGAAQFGVAQPADLILARAADQPVRCIAAIYRRSPIAFISLSDAGILRPQDFVGKTIRSVKTVDLTLRAMLERLDIAPDQYQTVYLPSEVALFASGDPPVWGVFFTVFAVDVQRAGYAINLIYPDDYGIHFYGDVLITSDDLITRQPEVVQRFLRAALQGWTYVVENPQAAGAIVQKVNPVLDPATEVAKMEASIPLVNTGKDFIGWMEADMWDGMVHTLRQQAVLTRTLDVTEVYTLRFLEEIYTLP